MTETREFYAANVKDALSKAAKTLGVTPEDLSYDVLDEGSEGFLGIGVRDARISVRVPAPTAEGSAEGPAESAAPESAQNKAVEAYPEAEQHAGGTEERSEAPEELLAEIRRLSSEIVENMGLKANIDVYDAGDCIAVDLNSDHTALLIGQKGETIDALQYLINVAIYRKRESVKRIVLDSEGYRQRRVEAIQGMAHRTARKALREKRPVRMPPMSAFERRVVHLFLRDNAKVTTFSEGSGENRRVTVAPA